MEHFKKNLKLEENIALVLGGHINAYGIVRSLYGHCNIAIVADSNAMVSVSKLIDTFIPYNKNSSILKTINDFAKQNNSKKIILFATADWHLDEICQSNLEQNVLWTSHQFNTSFNSKINQYKLAKSAQVDCPETYSGTRKSIIENIKKIKDFTCVVKPESRDNRELTSKNYFRAKKFSCNSELISFLNSNSEDDSFLVSEVIEADPREVWSCLCICSEGKIIAYWTGRKLSQSPWQFGVFASSLAKWNKDVYESARRLVKEGNFTGIVQPEFKYCIKRNKYFLMEINFRYMMWHYAGKLAGVNIPYIDMLNATNQKLTCKLNNRKQTVTSKIYTYNTLHLVNVIKGDHIFKNLILFFRYFLNPFVIHASFCTRDWKPFLKNTFGRFKK